MKEQMYSGIDTLDGEPSLMWVRGDIMAITTDEGDDDLWRTQDPESTRSINSYCTDPHNPGRFTDLTLVWERDV